MSDATVRQWLLAHTPLEPSLLEGPGFAALVAERIATAAGGDAATYIEALEHRPDEVERLAAGIAVPETWLFRYPNSFELLTDVLRRRLASGATSVRMCSVGCATGQEPYCMAIAALHAGWAPEQVRIDAFDRSPEALEAAATGRYGAGSIRGPIPPWAAEYLERESGAILIDSRARGMVRFARAEITSSGIEGPYDVIFCRNVLIYLNAGARARLVRELCASLALGGVLFVGHAEHFLRGEPALRPIALPHTFALERPLEPAPPEEMLARARPAPARAAARPPARLPARTVAAPAAAPLANSSGRLVGGPSDGDALEDARGLADAGRMPESEALIQKVIARRGPSAAALELLGLIRIAANDITSAKRLFEQALYLDPTRSASLLQLAMISERAGDPHRASMYWGRAHRASAPTAGEGRP